MKVHVVDSRRHRHDLVMAAVLRRLDASPHQVVRPVDAHAVVLVDVGQSLPSFGLDKRLRDLPAIEVEVLRGRFVITLSQHGSLSSWDDWVDGVPSKVSVLSVDAAANAVVGLLDRLDPSKDSATVAAEHQLQMALESFVVLWEQSSADLALSLDDRRNGDALARAVGELAKSDEPPLDVLRATFTWFAKKLDLFTDEAAKSAGQAYGKATGTAAGVATVAAVTAAATRILSSDRS